MGPFEIVLCIMLNSSRIVELVENRKKRFGPRQVFNEQK